MRVGFFGDGPWAVASLELIAADSSWEIAFICGRSSRLDRDLEKFAKENQIPFLRPDDVNSSEFVSRAKSYNCLLHVSVAYNQIFRSALLNSSALGILNCHAGALPYYRGRNILNWALINDEQWFGVTVHHVDSGIDTGDIVVQELLPINDSDTYATLLERAVPKCAELVLRAISEVASGIGARIPQSLIDPVGLYCVGRRDGDEIIDWHQSSRRIFNFVRALVAPGPESRTYLNGNEIRIRGVRLIPGARSFIGVPGSVLAKDGSTLRVKTGDTMVDVVDFSSEEAVRIGDRFD